MAKPSARELLDRMKGWHVTSAEFDLAARVEKVLVHWQDVEARSAEAHAVYQQEAHRRGDVRHPDAYADLSEPTKEWDRVLVRWVLDTNLRLLNGEDE
jgi:hypothetical protein